MVLPSENVLSDEATAAKAPLVVEIMGPAGAGKTTLSRALRQRDENIAPDIDHRLSKLDKLPFVVGNTFSLLPTYLRHYRHSRWFNRRETRSMAYLQAGLHLLEEETSNSDRVTILDHGPIYRLAFLREFGPAITTSQLYQQWWAELLEEWMERIDIVVLLDAPDAILLKRVRARDSWNFIKDKSDEEAVDILRRYRAAFEQTMSESLNARRVKSLRFDTAQICTEDIAAKVLAELVLARQVGQVRERDSRLRGT